jgi:hypothetical protein
MPISSDDLWGTEASGAASPDHCKYCYQDGKFTQPDLTMQQMIDLCVPFMVEKGMDAEYARKIMTDSLPKLKRWC